MTLEISQQVPLAPRTTLRAQATAAWLVTVTDAADLPEVFALPQASGPILVLGEGSNVLFSDDYPGLVVHPRLMGIDILKDGRVRAAAGEHWHRFVRWSLTEGYMGLENLALIPGSVGAAPVQNIGAYGTELDEFVSEVEVWDRLTGSRAILEAGQCAFSYRDSCFKRLPDRHVILAVVFDLPRERPLRLDYAGVRDELVSAGITAPSATDVADAVERIRRQKLPDPAVLGNAGSFFKNPVVTVERASELAEANPGMPSWPAEHGVKLSAAWLLEHAGFKGLREGDAGFSGKHALVLVNYGHASGADLMALASRAQAAVAERYGVELEPEPRII